MNKPAPLQLTRRALLRTAATVAGAQAANVAASTIIPFLPVAQQNQTVGRNTPRTRSKATDMRVEEVSYNFEDYLYRAPYKFGGRVVDRVTLLNVYCTARSSDGHAAQGFGSMTLGNMWAFPSRVMSYDTTLGAMKMLAGRIQKITAEYQGNGHPIEINFALEPLYLQAAAEVSRELKLAALIPKLCMLVVASPFDAAMHDAFGKLHNRSAYQTYGPDLMSYDLARYLGIDFRGEYLDRYVRRMPVARMHVYHSVGALDPLTAADIKQRIGDGLPETLPEWINYNGITHVKIKLNGEDAKWDIERVVSIDRVVAETLEQGRRKPVSWKYLLDFNENCADVDYLLEVLGQIKVRTPDGFRRIQYVEQPTARDLQANRSN
ncbi:MAG: hypothetical protein H0T92_03325, partial [Pyrinomonadaceae bacterium]|nr:hypothetical protein [Pyrinomonadaceae bacterium]